MYERTETIVSLCSKYLTQSLLGEKELENRIKVILVTVKKKLTDHLTPTLK